MAVGFEGLRVVSFESRRSGELGGLLERLGARVRRAPALREVPVDASPTAAAFAERLLAGGLDVVVFLTGVGARALMAAVEPRFGRDAIRAALGRCVLAVRGPKPLAVLREWGLTPDILAPEPNTWRELLAALDEAGPMAGKRVAVQEYGESNGELLEALRQRGAEVLAVEVYAWALPEDLGPLQEAIRAIVAGEVDVLAFTSAQQARHLMLVADRMGLETGLRSALRRTVIGSVGPTCSRALHELGLGVDFEPDRTRMGDLARGLARGARGWLERKRASDARGVDVATARRVDLVWPEPEGGNGDPLHDSPFLRACRREKVPYTPIWIMRQAGRYLREYRELRAKVSFLEMCKRPELAAEVTLMAVDRLGVDAAIIFADILLVAEPMGAGLSFHEGEGPRILRPVRSARDVDALAEVEPEALSFVYEAVRMTRRALPPHVPLIGFCGAPFTVASYLIEGGASRHFQNTKMLMYRDPGAWHALMQRLVRASAGYLNGQIDAGAQAVQIFDSWVGCLSSDDYRAFVLPHTDALIHAVKPGVPIIYFGVDTAALLGAMRDTGVDVIGLDWRVNLRQTWACLGHDVAVQGNLDPVVLFATPAEIQRRARQILDEAENRPGHIFNLGHGVLPNTPVDHVLALVDEVHEYSRR
ncbi:MAG: uroporphyrinogen decarboxylase [Phycisphaerae bacterium]|jgi:uroporphyrinogen decarboxylase